MTWEDEERRGNQRVELSEQIFVKTVSASDVLIVSDEPDEEGGAIGTTIDVSHCGLRIYLEQDVVEGSSMGLWVEVGDESDRVFLTGLVMWSHGSGEGYLVGVKLEENSEDDVGAWQKLIEYKDAHPE